jgi:hypothetical protein
MYDLPLDDKMPKLRQMLFNCSILLGTAEARQSMEEEWSYNLVANCSSVVDVLRKKKRSKYLFEVIACVKCGSGAPLTGGWQTLDGEGKDIGFKMVRDNVTQVYRQLDHLRKERPKFICLNDNIDHRKKSAAQVCVMVCVMVCVSVSE